MSKASIRRAVRLGRYEYTAHALDEMEEDNLSDADVMSVLQNGQLVATLTDDPRGERYVIRQIAVPNDIEVICRLLPSGLLRIITVYSVQ